jgi:hypothetical protein
MKKMKKIPNGIQLAFCATGKGGKVDNSCSPANKGARRIRPAEKLNADAVDKLIDEFQSVVDYLEAWEADSEESDEVQGLRAYTGNAYDEMNEYARNGGYDQASIDELNEQIEALEEQLAEAEEESNDYYDLEEEIAEKQVELRTLSGDEFLDIHGLDTEAAVDGLDSLLRQSPGIDEDIVVIRGIRSPRLLNVKAGDTIVDNGFVSTTLDEEVANRFGAGVSRLIINVPAKTPLLFLTDRNEAEVLLPRGLKMKVADAEERPNGDGVSKTKYVYADIIKEDIQLAFCATGKGGKVDNSCSPANKGEGEKYIEKLWADEEQKFALASYVNEGYVLLNRVLRRYDGDFDQFEKQTLEKQAEIKAQLKELRKKIKAAPDNQELATEKHELDKKAWDIKRDLQMLNDYEKEHGVDARTAYDKLLKMIDKAPAAEADMVVARGFIDRGDFGKLTVGSVFKDKGLVSTATSEKIARKFGSDQFIITLPKSIKRLPIGGDEAEVLLPPGLSFKVTDVQRLGYGTHYKVEVVQ